MGAKACMGESRLSRGWAAASLCFFGFLRSGEMTVPEGAQYDELTHLNFRDLAVDSRENPPVHSRYG